MKLSGLETENLSEALQDGYPSYEKLKIMVRFKLGKNLAEISPKIELETVIFELIEWAESNNTTLDLVWGANERNPGNSKIKKITYQFCSITKKQWDDLCQLISQINPFFLEAACEESFQPKKIVEVDFQLIDLKRFTPEKIKDILKENLIKKREQSARKIPIILEFADCLSKMPSKKINPIRNDLKKWISEVVDQLSPLDNQLKNKLQTKEKNESLSKSVKIETIQPYLLISLEKTGSDLLLQGELVIQKNNTDAILQQESIYIQDQKQGINCENKPEKIGYYLKQFIEKSYVKSKYYCYQNSNTKLNKSIIVELFLPVLYFLDSMETIPLPMESSGLFAGENMTLCCQYPLTFRALERFEFYQNNPEYSVRLEDNWKEVNDFFKSQLPLTSEVIDNKFEYHTYCHGKWKILEQRLRENQKIGINIVSPLKSLAETEDVMKAIIVAGIPIALWSINLKNTPEKLRQSFIQLLTFKGIRNLTSLLHCVAKLRGKAYNSENFNSLGYGLGFLCDNPYRIPSRFKEEEDDVFTFWLKLKKEYN